MHGMVISGYPRSGNTYLSYALQLLYYPDKDWNLPRHTVVSIENNNKVIVPFRNPLDCISSWHSFFSDLPIKSHIDFYIRFNSAVIENLNKVVLMDFDLFTKNLGYVVDRVFTNFGVSPASTTTDFEIKSIMIEKEKEVNLPRKNQEELNIIKGRLLEEPLFEQCLALHNKLKEQ